MSLKVVLAEDDPDIQLVARLSLKRAGFQVVLATNGREALERVTSEMPDVALLDWMMPELDGVEVCRRLKADPATAAVPVIFLTARSQEQELKTGLSIGAIGYITKPFDALTLGDRVRELLGV
ncbi:MAG: response regulator [Acidobacteria bacterium]|nr:MAG: response regulator [Acidobacteriota bacterium]